MANTPKKQENSDDVLAALEEALSGTEQKKPETEPTAEKRAGLPSPGAPPAPDRPALARQRPPTHCRRTEARLPRSAHRAMDR